METPPRARGTGRSGPRRRTGCLTCRARKVRCDETKPVCANCTRLRLQCDYKTIIPGLVSRRSHPQRASSTTTTSSAGTTFPADPPTHHHPSAPDRPDLNYFDTVLQQDEQRRQQLSQWSNPTGSEKPRLPAASPTQETGPYGVVDFAGFDMLGFIGEITSDFEQKHLDLTNGMSDFPPVTASPMPSPMGQSVGFPEPHIWTTAGTPSVGEVSLSSAGHKNDSVEPAAAELSLDGIWPETRASYEEQLISWFLESEAPPTIFGPLNLEWPFVRGIIVAQSRDFSALRNSLYCYADLQRAMAEGKRWNLAPTYHQHASADIQTCLLGEVGPSMLKRVFTAVFLLMLSELIAPSEMWRPGTSFLHSAFLLLQRFHRQTKTWTGFNHLIISWVSLLDVKALIAGRDGDPLIELGSVTVENLIATSSSHPGRKDVPKSANNHHVPPSIDNTSPINGGTTANEADDDDILLSKPAYLIHDAIVGPAFRFFFQAQQVIRRIVCIDLHHRSRGTVSDEFEVLQIAHQVGADLETLWNNRPRVLDVYDRPQDLCDTLRPSVAAEVCRTFRQYLANFLAIFIYLHRVAFAIYPRTDRVHRAVDQIIQLATVESTSRGDTSSSTTAVTHLPISFIWPLFVAGLEGSLEQRAWIVLEMQRMATTSVDETGSGNGRTPGTPRHPNANKALLLLEEMTRRQDTSRTWADSRCVRRELFTEFFVMI